MGYCKIWFWTENAWPYSAQKSCFKFPYHGVCVLSLVIRYLVDFLIYLYLWKTIVIQVLVWKTNVPWKKYFEMGSRPWRNVFLLNRIYLLVIAQASYNEKSVYISSRVEDHFCQKKMFKKMFRINRIFGDYEYLRNIILTKRLLLSSHPSTIFQISI